MTILRLLFPWIVGLALCGEASATNPFLDAPDDKPDSAKFKGAEWGEVIPQKELPFSARVVTTRIATAAWGSIFKISFEDIVSRAPQRREITPLYFIVTDDQIVLLNEEKPEEAAARIAALAQPPAFEPSYVYGLSKGARKHQEDDLSGSKLAVKGDLSTYQWSHNSGHFTTVVWKRGVGLLEYAAGRGARADGYRLKRETASKQKTKR